MGLLAYKAHCSTVDDSTYYACATDSEMMHYIRDQNVRLKIESHGSEKNLVVHFDPFPVKYLNYVKKYNTKKPYKVLRGDESLELVRKIENNHNQIYIQLFRICRKASVLSSWDTTNYVTSFWHGDPTSEGLATAKAIAGSARGLTTCSKYTGDPKTTRFKNFRTYFKYCLTPEDAARGYMVVLRNLKMDETINNDHKMTLIYGTSGDHPGNDYGRYDFHYGLAAGLVGPQDVRKYNPVEDDVTPAHWRTWFPNNS